MADMNKIKRIEGGTLKTVRAQDATIPLNVQTYSGPYTVTPTAEQQTLNTRNRLLSSNVTVEAAAITTDYNDLENKPQINGVTLQGNKNLEDLGIPTIESVTNKYTKPASGIPAVDIADGVIPDVSGFYTKPASGIPATDIASGVIPDVSGFYTKPAGGIPATDIADGVIPDVSGFYEKPATGIPATDIADGVIPDVSGFYTKPAAGIPASDIASGVIPDVTGKLDAPSTAGTQGQVLTSDGNGGQTWQTPQGGGGGASITDTASGAIASFPDGADDVPMDSVKVQIEPVQDLHGYPSPWAAGAGKNVFDKSILQSNTNVSVSQTDNAIVVTQLAAGTFKSSSEYFSFTGHDGETLYVKADITVSASNIGYLSVQFYNASAEVDSTKRIELSNRSTAPKSNTVPTGTTRIRIMTYVNSNGTGVVGNTATFANVILSLSDVPYSPYSNVCPISGWTGANVVHSPTDDAEDGTTYPFTWSQAGTVYGGELNVTTGVLTVDSANISSYAGETLPGRWISDRDAYAAGTTPTTGAQVVYKLATPVTYQLTPAQINTLFGQNNVWSDTGDTSVTYKADLMLWVGKKLAEGAIDLSGIIAPVEDTSSASQSYAVGSLLIYNETLYKVTSAISSGGTITPGSNVTATTMEAISASKATVSGTPSNGDFLVYSSSAGSYVPTTMSSWQGGSY